MKEKMITRRELAEFLGLHPQTVCEMVWRENPIPHYRIFQGKRATLRFLPSEIHKWMASRHVTTHQDLVRISKSAA